MSLCLCQRGVVGQITYCRRPLSIACQIMSNNVNVNVKAGRRGDELAARPRRRAARAPPPPSPRRAASNAGHDAAPPRAQYLRQLTFFFSIWKFYPPVVSLQYPESPLGLCTSISLLSIPSSNAPHRGSAACCCGSVVFSEPEISMSPHTWPRVSGKTWMRATPSQEM